MKASQEFVVGKHGIGWVDSDFKERFGGKEFDPRTLGSFQKLGKAMTGDQIIAGDLAKECELGDVLAFLKNPPEGTKDGWGNLFVLSEFVVRVDWHADGRGWRVSTWNRGGRWGADNRVFSPATAAKTLETQPPEPSDSLTFEISKLTAQIKRVADALEKKGKKLRRSDKLRILINIADHFGHTMGRSFDYYMRRGLKIDHGI